MNLGVGDTIEETIQMMKEALEFHFEGTIEEGLPIPEPTSVVNYVEVEIPTAQPQA